MRGSEKEETEVSIYKLALWWKGALRPKSAHEVQRDLRRKIRINSNIEVSSKETEIFFKF